RQINQASMAINQSGPDKGIVGSLRRFRLRNIAVAFGGKADMTIGTCPLSRSLLGVKRTWCFALHMSAFDPKRTSVLLSNLWLCQLSSSHIPIPGVDAPAKSLHSLLCALR